MNEQVLSVRQKIGAEKEKQNQHINKHFSWCHVGSPIPQIALMTVSATIINHPLIVAVDLKGSVRVCPLLLRLSKKSNLSSQPCPHQPSIIHRRAAVSGKQGIIAGGGEDITPAVFSPSLSLSPTLQNNKYFLSPKRLSRRRSSERKPLAHFYMD